MVNTPSKNFIHLNNKVQHTANVVYLGKCLSCKADYVGETCRNYKTRQSGARKSKSQLLAGQPHRDRQRTQFRMKGSKHSQTMETTEIERTMHIYCKLKNELNKQIKYFELRLLQEE